MIIPSTWEMVMLKEVLTSIKNGTTQEQNQDKQGLPVTRIETISHSEIDAERVGWIKNYDALIANYLLQKGDILFSHINSLEHVGKCAIYEGNPTKILHGMNLLLLKCNEQLINPYFLLYYLRSQSAIYAIKARTGRAVNQVSINQSSLETLQIPLPPLSEQRRIAAILREADEIRKLRQQANEKSKQLYKNLFHDYFYSDQKDANETEFIKLKELLAVPLSSGFSPVSKDVPPGIAVFSLSAITDFGLDETQIKYYPVKSYRGRGDDLEVDDILITRSNTLEFVGKVARYLGKPYPVIYPDLVIRIRLKNRNDSPYLENFLRSSMMISTIRKFARGTSGSMKKISQGDINDFDIYLPSIEKRYAYAELVKMIDKQIELQATALTKINTLYQSLLVQAFSGELTASWRKSQSTELWRESLRAELEQAAEERDRLRKGLDGATKALPPQQPHKSQITNRLELTKGLTRLQTVLLALIEEQDDTYFTATRVHDDIWLHMDEQGIYLEASDREGKYRLFAGLDCSLDTTRRELHFLARMGLVKELTLPVEEESGVGIVHYITAYRSLRVDDDCQQQDLGLLNPVLGQEALT